MNKRTLLVAAILGGSSLQMSAQEFLSKNAAGDKEYKKVCREYELKNSNSVELLNEYLDKHPDTRFRNRIEALIGASYYDKGQYKEAIAMLRSCDIDALAESERDLTALKLANAYLKENDYKEAYSWFTTLKEVSAKYRTDAIYNIAYIDYVNKRYDSALNGFEQVKNEEPFNIYAPYYIGEIYLIRGEYQKAASIASNYLSQYLDSSEAYEMRRIAGEAAYSLGDYTQAAFSLEKYVAATSAPKRNALYKLGMSYYNTGVYSKAAENLGRMTTEQDALTQNAYYNMGLSYLNLKDRNMARMAFEQASNLSFDCSIKEQALYNYALLIHETSYSPFAESVTVFEKFLNDYPNSKYTEKVNGYLVEVYMNTKSYQAALESIQKINRPGATILEAKQNILFQLGTQAFINSNYDEALSLFKQSLALGQYNSEVKANAYYWSGETEYRMENYNNAIQYFKNYLSTTSQKNSEEYALALYNIGYSYFKQSKYVDALPWFNKFEDSTAPRQKVARADAYNRIGDCNFFERRFDTAENNYAAAAATDNSMADYSLFQEAFIKGLKKDYRGKIATLNKVISDYPSSEYIDDAIYEQGRAFVQMEDNANAIKRFNILPEKFPNSDYTRKAVSEVALLYYQDDKYPEAIKTYKYVIANYPGSDEARMALRDLKNIYIDMNKVDEYADFVSSIPGMTTLDNSERDSLTYAAAEKVYMRGNVSQARNSFLAYLQSYPNGAYSLDANYNIGLIDYNNKKYDESEKYLEHVLKYPSNKYSEEALMMMASMVSEKNDHAKALAIYKQLKQKASSSERTIVAETGILRNAYVLNQHNDVISAASALLASTKLSPELENEAHYYRAKVYEEMKDYNKAKADWKVLSKDTRNVFGAEGKYRLAQIDFNQGNTSAAENEILNYIDVSTPHAYWLARGFILLSDIYIKSNRNLEAKQYLLSLKQNYHANDDITEMIESRLKKLGQND